MHTNASARGPASGRCFGSVWRAGFKAGGGWGGWLLSCAVAVPIWSWAAPVTDDIDLHTPQVGEHALHILTPNLLELVLINTKQPDPAKVQGWDWVDDQQHFMPPDPGHIRVLVNGQANFVSGVGFKRRPVYAPLLVWDLRIGNRLYLQLTNTIGAGSTVQVLNDGALWATDLVFEAVADPLRFNPAIHVNQEGYLPAYPKKATVGYYVGDLGEMSIPTNRFFLVDTQTGATVYQGTLTLRKDVGYTYSPTPYQSVYEADFTGWTTPGEYWLAVPGLGASPPFRVDDGIAMDFARTYALGMFEQRGGFDVAMPFTRFTHAADHLAPAGVPTNDSAPFAFTWQTVSNYATEINPDNPPQVAPVLTNFSAQLFPFVHPGSVSVSGGHFEAGDYNRVTYNGAQLIHTLVFAADALPGVGDLDNLGIPESGDGISDVLQEAKWEADFLAKMQDDDGGFYYSVYPQSREYEFDVLPENGDPQVVWPKNTASTAAAVAALAECASSPRLRQAFPQAASNYLAKAVLGWQFLTNAIARFGLEGSYQKVQHFDEDFTLHDELAWAACELFLATGDAQYQAKLFEWFPHPSDPATFRWGWQRMGVCYGNAIRDYAFAARTGRVAAGQLDPGYLAECINVITNRAADVLGWSQDNAYGTSFPDLTKAYEGGGWYFSAEQAFDLVVAYQFAPDPSYVDALIRNLNYEAGCNPVNVCYLTGLGWKRMRNVVDQYSLNDRRALPKDGVPVSNIETGFEPVWTYQWELGNLVYPSDYSDTAPYPFYDRWCDDWNVSTEGSTTDTARGFASAAWLAARTTAAAKPWHVTQATLNVPNPVAGGTSATVRLSVEETNLQSARIIWEAQGQEPGFGGLSYSFPPQSQTGTYWIEAEVQWPDGRRAFAKDALTVSGNTPPQLALPQGQTGGGFSLVLTGTPLATYVVQVSSDLSNWSALQTNTLPANGVLTINDPLGMTAAGARFYRARQAP